MDSENYGIKISPSALKDFRNTIDYISEKLAAPSAAQALFNDFYDAVDRASMFPYAMAKVSKCDVADKDYRKILIRNFIAIYSIEETAKEIHIAAFRYAPGHLGDSI